jgi:hypothetical protein
MSIPRTGPELSAGVLTADLTRLGDELALLRGSAIYDGRDPAATWTSCSPGSAWPGKEYR